MADMSTYELWSYFLPYGILILVVFIVMVRPCSRTHGEAICMLTSKFQAIYNVSRKPLSHLPGPWYSKWTDVILTFQWLSGRRAFYVHKLHQIYGK
jgi:hypothetical protein